MESKQPQDEHHLLKWGTKTHGLRLETHEEVNKSTIQDRDTRSQLPHEPPVIAFSRQALRSAGNVCPGALRPACHLTILSGRPSFDPRGQRASVRTIRSQSSRARPRKAAQESWDACTRVQRRGTGSHEIVVTGHQVSTRGGGWAFLNVLRAQQAWHRSRRASTLRPVQHLGRRRASVSQATGWALSTPATP